MEESQEQPSDAYESVWRAASSAMHAAERVADAVAWVHLLHAGAEAAAEDADDARDALRAALILLGDALESLDPDVGGASA